MHLIDRMKDLLKQSQKDNAGTHFQVASCTLDDAVKIYAYRVASVHNKAYKLLGSLGRVVKNPENGIVSFPLSYCSLLIPHCLFTMRCCCCFCGVYSFFERNKNKTNVSCETRHQFKILNQWTWLDNSVSHVSCLIIKTYWYFTHLLDCFWFLVNFSFPSVYTSARQRTTRFPTSPFLQLTGKLPDFWKRMSINKRLKANYA